MILEYNAEERYVSEIKKIAAVKYYWNIVLRRRHWKAIIEVSSKFKISKINVFCKQTANGSFCVFFPTACLILRERDSRVHDLCKQYLLRVYRRI